MKDDEWNTNELLTGFEERISRSEVKDVSLFYGKSGICLFYFALFRYFGDPVYLTRCERLVADIVEGTGSLKANYSFSRGLAGVAWVLDFLCRRGVHHNTGYQAELDPLLYINSLRALMNGDMSFFDGSLGTVLYAANRLPDEKAMGYLYQYGAVIKSKMNRDHKLPPWNYFGDAGDNAEAMGMGNRAALCSLVNIFMGIFKKGLMKSETEIMVDRSLSWLASVHEAQVAGNLKAMGGDLTLQQGILSVAWSFWKAGVTFKRELWQLHALRLVDYSIQISNKIDHSELDASLLKGTSGIAHLFSRFYRETGDDRCLLQYQYWIRITLRKIAERWKPAENLTVSANAKTPVVDSQETLDGIAGVGLAVLSAHNEEVLNWDECLFAVCG